MSKGDWIALFRDESQKKFQKVIFSKKNPKDRAALYNKLLKDAYGNCVSEISARAAREAWDNGQILEEVLACTYASYVVMLESRNSVWPYEYMAFARRIGELWEPFCKLPFLYPLRRLQIVEPPSFESYQNSVQDEAHAYIASLGINSKDKDELLRMYSLPWELVDSGGIQLALDLHFKQDGFIYNCDLKSGFSSNEKGNTNRLLLVASIYASMNANQKALLFVRQNEDENNHYLQTLKNSPYWDVYCAGDCYRAMAQFTGFDLRSWLDNNADWLNDITPSFRAHLQENDLLRYLTW